MPLLKLVLYKLERLMQIFVPEVYTTLLVKEVPYEVFSIQWYLSLFSCDFDSSNLITLLDLFLILHWKFIFQLSIVILKKMREKIELLKPDKLAVYLKSALSQNLIPRVLLLKKSDRM